MTSTDSPSHVTPVAPIAYTLSDFDFALPPALIAQHPTPQRSASRLLDGRAAQPVDRIFKDLPSLLRAGDLLVFNDTRVVKARVFGEKASGGKLELLIERVLSEGDDNEVVAHMKVSKKPLPGAVVHMAGGQRNGGFDALLLGRWRFGWRGRTARRMLYVGAALLLLAYVGSRFVLEVLLERGL